MNGQVKIILKGLVNLPDGAWYEDEDLTDTMRDFKEGFVILIRKRKYLQEQLEIARTFK